MAEIRVNVSSVGSKGTAQATNNAAQYWAEKAREWAISENPVSMEDNSSKYYAGKAKEYAQSAQQYKNDTQEIADTAESNIDDLTSDFSSLYTEKSEALQSEYSNYSSSLEAAKTSAITSIQTTGTEVNTSITTASTSALSDITTAKNTAVEDIQDEADTQISNIQSTGFYMRDGRLYYVDSEGQEQEFKSGGGGLPLFFISPALYVDESLGLDYYLNGQLLTVNANLQGAVDKLKKLKAIRPSLFCTEEEWQAEKEASDHGQVGKFVLNYAQAEVEKQCSIFGGYDIITEVSEYWLVEKAQNDVEVGDLAYPCDSSGAKTGEDAVAITAVWTGAYTGKPIISITEDGLNGKSFHSEVTLTETITTDEIVSFRLPAVINIQGVFDLQNAGLLVEAGLPNIKGMVYYGHGYLANATGAFYRGNAGTLQRVASGGAETDYNLLFDASRSNPIYGNNTTVQEEAIQYPWVIRLATGQETEVNIRNDIESIVPYTLFDSKYSEAKQYNASWGLGGSILSKSVYPTAYEAALVEYNSEVADGTTVELPSGGSYTKRGVSGGITVKLSTDETVTEYDWKLDTVAETLTVPTLNGSEDLLSDRYDDLELKASGSTYTAPANGWFWIQKLSSSTGQYLTPVIKDSNGNIKYTLTSQPTAAGYDAEILAPVSKGDVISIGYSVGGATKSFRFIYAKSNGSLYFFVASVAQNAPLANLGRIEETKVDKNSSWGFPSNRYIDLELGASGSTYTAPANGYFFIDKLMTATQQVLALAYNELVNDAWVFGSMMRGVGNNYSQAVWLPAKRGQVVRCNYDGNETCRLFRFYYAEGEV